METILTSGALEVIDFNLSKLYVALKINFKHKTNFISGEPKQVVLCSNLSLDTRVSKITANIK